MSSSRPVECVRVYTRTPCSGSLPRGITRIHSPVIARNGTTASLETSRSFLVFSFLRLKLALRTAFYNHGASGDAPRKRLQHRPGSSVASINRCSLERSGIFLQSSLARFEFRVCLSPSKLDRPVARSNPSEMKLYPTLSAFIRSERTPSRVDEGRGGRGEVLEEVSPCAENPESPASRITNHFLGPRNLAN